MIVVEKTHAVFADFYQTNRKYFGGRPASFGVDLFCSVEFEERRFIDKDCRQAICSFRQISRCISQILTVNPL